MLSITEFSRLSGLPVKTLRHYHAKGVLVPRHVDEHTQYRWYGVGQVASAVQIGAMRRAGMSLAEVRGLIEDVDLVPGALRRHRRRIDLERMDQDAAVAELDDATAEQFSPMIRQRAACTVLTTVGTWQHGNAEDRPDAEWEQEVVELRRELVAVAAERGLKISDDRWTALEVRGEVVAQRVGQPLTDEGSSDDTSGGVRRDISDRAAVDLPAHVSLRYDAPAEEVVIGLRPGAERAAARQAMIAVLSFSSDGLIADPRTLRFVDQDGRGNAFTALLIPDPRDRRETNP